MSINSNALYTLLSPFHSAQNMGQIGTPQTPFNQSVRLVLLVVVFAIELKA